jgi:3'(2'), 5'-bisphosphate nucleotidase
MIVAQLQDITADLPVLSEETKAAPYSDREGWDEFWLIDPLDGTKEFVKRNGEFTINIALIANQEPVLGVVHAPALDTSYFGARGAGAFKRVQGDGPSPIAVNGCLFPPLTVVASRSHESDALSKFLETLGRIEIKNVGSSLKLCLVADGSAQLYPRLGPTMEWDTAAGQCVLEQAGGIVADLQGKRLIYNKPNLLNPHFIASSSSAFPWESSFLRSET